MIRGYLQFWLLIYVALLKICAKICFENISGAENPCSGIAALYLGDQIINWYKSVLSSIFRINGYQLRIKAQADICPFKSALKSFMAYYQTIISMVPGGLL